MAFDNQRRLDYYLMYNRGDVAQLGERFNRTEEVEGSNPFVSTFAL